MQPSLLNTVAQKNFWGPERFDPFSWARDWFPYVSWFFLMSQRLIHLLYSERLDTLYSWTEILSIFNGVTRFWISSRQCLVWSAPWSIIAKLHEISLNIKYLYRLVSRFLIWSDRFVYIGRGNWRKTAVVWPPFNGLLRSVCISLWSTSLLSQILIDEKLTFFRNIRYVLNYQQLLLPRWPMLDSIQLPRLFLWDHERFCTSWIWLSWLQFHRIFVEYWDMILCVLMDIRPSEFRRALFCNSFSCCIWYNRFLDDQWQSPDISMPYAILRDGFVFWSSAL